MAFLLSSINRIPSYLDLAEPPDLRYEQPKLSSFPHLLTRPLGDRFRYRPNGVLIASPKGYHDIYNAKANVKKAKWYEVWRKNDKDFNALNTVDPHKHTAMRKPLNSAFSDKSLRSAEPFITKNVDRWIEVLLDGEKRTDTTEWSTPKNLGGEWVDYLIFDILGDLCFGRSFETIEPGDNPLRQIPHIIGGYLQFMYPVSFGIFLCYHFRRNPD